MLFSVTFMTWTASVCFTLFSVLQAPGLLAIRRLRGSSEPHRPSMQEKLPLSKMEVGIFWVNEKFSYICCSCVCYFYFAKKNTVITSWSFGSLVCGIILRVALTEHLLLCSAVGCKSILEFLEKEPNSLTRWLIMAERKRRLPGTILSRSPVFSKSLKSIWRQY